MIKIEIRIQIIKIKIKIKITVKNQTLVKQLIITECITIRLCIKFKN